MTIWAPNLQKAGPIAREIVTALARDIEEGRLAPGTRLPTHRELSERLGVAIGTVTRAYAIAKEEGLVTGTVGRGMFVVRPASQEQTGSAPGRLIELTQNFVARDAKDAAIRKALSFLGDPAEIAPLIDGDQSAAGCERHRNAAARWLSRPGFSVAANQVVITAGVQHAIFVALAALTRPGDTILAEQVTYTGIRAIASLLHLRVRGLPMDGDGLQPDAFERACADGAKLLYTVPTLQNPTGSVMREARRNEIARLARAHGLTILEDDVYGFLLREAPLPLTAFAPERCYYLWGSSKSIAPGIRVGFMVCPAEQQQRIAAAVRSTVWETAPLMAELMVRWLEDGTAERVIAWKREETEARNALAARILGRFAPASSPASCHLWIPLPPPWRNEEFVAQCRARGVAVSPADAFVAGREPAPHAIRVCIATIGSRERLESGLRIIAELLSSSPDPGFALT